MQCLCTTVCRRLLISPFSFQERSQPLTIPPPSLLHLRHLALDAGYFLVPSSVPSVLHSILALLRPSFPSLSSFTLKLSDPSIQVGGPFIQELLAVHAATLRRIAFINCGIGDESLAELCRDCINLERLELCIPVKDIFAPTFLDLLPLSSQPTPQRGFVSAISKSTSLRTLVDRSDSHVTHGPRPTLSRDTVRYVMAVSSLRTIVSDSKVWTVSLSFFHLLLGFLTS